MFGSSQSDSQAEELQPGFVGSGGDLQDLGGALSTRRDLDAPRPRRRRLDLIQRLAFGGAALLLLVGMAPGLAYAADGAIPGDLLYRLDRAFEAVGYYDGGATERLAEVDALIATGAAAEGLRHAAVTLDGHPGGDEARAALVAAAARSEEVSESPGSQTAQVGGLVEYLHRTAASDRPVNGQTVAEMARDLGVSKDHSAGPPTDRGSQGTERGESPTDPGSRGTGRDKSPTEPRSQGTGRGGPEKGRNGK